MGVVAVTGLRPIPAFDPAEALAASAEYLRFLAQRTLAPTRLPPALHDALAPGDLVFFDNTWDYNGDGMANDPLTHVGIVERQEDDGTIVFISRVAGAIERYEAERERSGPVTTSLA